MRNVKNIESHFFRTDLKIKHVSFLLQFFLIDIFLTSSDGKYVVLPSGELQIRNVVKEDGDKTYKCRTKHRLTGETKLSATAGRLVITGKPLYPLLCVSCNLA